MGSISPLLESPQKIECRQKFWAQIFFYILSPPKIEYQQKFWAQNIFYILSS